MNRHILFLIAFVSFSLFGTISVLAGSVFVSEVDLGNVIKVDELGTKTIYASGLDLAGNLKFDKNGNLFVLAFNSSLAIFQILKISSNGSISTLPVGIPSSPLRGYSDLTVSDDGKVFLLDNVFPDELHGEGFTEIWELFENGSTRLLATTQDAAPFGQTARGFTFGPGGHLYLAMQGGQALHVSCK